MRFSPFRFVLFTGAQEINRGKVVRLRDERNVKSQAAPQDISSYSHQTARLRSQTEIDQLASYCLSAHNHSA